jgi:hypothetical protein
MKRGAGNDSRTAFFPLFPPALRPQTNRHSKGEPNNRRKNLNT